MMNIRLFLLFLFVICTAQLMAEDSQERKVTPEKRAMIQRKILLAKGGDEVVRPGTQKGYVTIVNAQKDADVSWVSEAAKRIEQDTDIKVAVKAGTFDIANPVIEGNMTIFLADQKSLPRVLVAAEDRWAVINVSKIADKREQFFKARTKKLIARVFAMLCGGMSSGYELSLCGPMPTVSDLDVIPVDRLPVDVVMRVQRYVESYGVSPAIKKPYRQACKEGWAPAPTNDVQRIIWDGVHKLPSEPLKIKYDPARDGAKQ